jgi:o-succinylbenzoate synthase
VSVSAEVLRLRIPRRDPGEPPMETVILRLTAGDGTVAIGESAGARAFHGMDAEAIARELREIVLPGLDDGDPRASLLQRLSPPARCALDVALHDLLGREQGLRIADLLGGPRRTRVVVNALLPRFPEAAMLEVAREAWERGVGTFKIKSASLAEDVEALRTLRRTFGPGARLRLDANGAWTPKEAIERIRAIEPLGLEYIEQPVARGHLGEMARVAARSGIPIAADEDVTDPDAVARIAATGAASIIVVKLPTAGGIAGAMAMLRVAAEKGLGAVVTGMVDTSVGIAAALHVAAAADALAGACGFGTLDLLAGDVVEEPLRIENGAMLLPGGPGLGVQLDPGALARLRGGR